VEQGSAGDKVNPHVEEKRSGGSGELAAHAEEEVLVNGTNTTNRGCPCPLDLEGRTGPE
jgi:hypothetical protein